MPPPELLRLRQLGIGQFIGIMQQQFESAQVKDLGRDLIRFEFRRLETVFPKNRGKLLTQIGGFHNAETEKDAFRTEMRLFEKQVKNQSP